LGEIWENEIKFSSLKVCVTLCDDWIESSKKNFVNAFVQIELCHMKNAILATIFNTLINLALVTFLKNNGHNKLNTVLRDGIEGLIIKFSSLK
jgi:hypothetical protein